MIIIFRKGLDATRNVTELNWNNVDVRQDLNIELRFLIIRYILTITIGMEYGVYIQYRVRNVVQKERFK